MIVRRNFLARTAPAWHAIDARRAWIVLGAFIFSRCALLLVGLFTQILFEPTSSQISPMNFSASPLLRMWGQWDSDWYVSIAAHGYASAPQANGEVNWVFFPAFPMISRLVSIATGLPVFGSMLLVSNACFLAALYLVHLYATQQYDQRTGDLVVLLLCAAPGSYVFSSAYTESLFLLAITGVLLLIGQQRWLAAGLVAALAVMTRNLGIGLLIAFAFPIIPSLLHYGSGGRLTRVDGPFLSRGALIRALMGASLPLLAIAGFCTFLYVKSGDPLAFINGQRAWGRSLASPVDRLVGPIVSGRVHDMDLISFPMAWLAVAMLLLLAWSRHWMLFALGAFLCLIPLSSGLTSFARYSLVALPLWLAAADMLSRRPELSRQVTVLFATFNGFLMVAWTLGHGVTA